MRRQGARIALRSALNNIERLTGVERNMHMAIQTARGEEKSECARMAREYARAVSKGTFRKPATSEDWGEAIAKHIDIPF